VEQRQGITHAGTGKLIGRVVSFMHHKLEWWMIMLISIAALLLCHRCSCNKKAKTLQTHDDLVVDPREAIMESESKLDETAVKPVELMSPVSAKGDHRLELARHQNLLDSNEKLALGCPWVPLADKVAWWNSLEVLPRLPTNPTGYSAHLQVPPQELRTPPLVPSLWHQDVAFGVPVERCLSDGYCLSEMSGSSPPRAGPLISLPRTPGLSCSSQPETVSDAALPRTPSCSSHHLRFQEKVACSLPSLFQDHVGASCNHHNGRESRLSVPEWVQQAVRPLRERSSLEHVQQAVMPPPEGVLAERVQQAVLPPPEVVLPERVHRVVKPLRDGASPERVDRAVMPPREGAPPERVHRQ